MELQRSRRDVEVGLQTSTPAAPSIGFCEAARMPRRSGKVDGQSPKKRSESIRKLRRFSVSKLVVVGVCPIKRLSVFGIWDETHNFWVRWTSRTFLLKRKQPFFPAFFQVHVKTTGKSPGKLVSSLALWLKNWSQMVKNLGLEDGHSLLGFISGET